MWYFIALSNPGKEYENTRHNAGQMVLKKILSLKEVSYQEVANYTYLVKIGDQQCYFLFSNSFMNKSGDFIKKMKKIHELEPKEVIILHDDQDIPLGEVKLQYNRGSAGHNGIISIIASLQTQDFGRMRIGIERVTGDKTVDHVLGKFTDTELDMVDTATKVTFENIKNILTYGKDGAISRQ